jgi:hypothetical protein
MGHFSKTSNLAHDAAINTAEATRQVAVAAATTQAAVNAAEIVFHRAVLASAKANNSNQGVAESLSALKALGTGGT